MGIRRMVVVGDWALETRLNLKRDGLYVSEVETCGDVNRRIEKRSSVRFESLRSDEMLFSNGGILRL